MSHFWQRLQRGGLLCERPGLTAGHWSTHSQVDLIGRDQSQISLKNSSQRSLSRISCKNHSQEPLSRSLLRSSTSHLTSLHISLCLSSSHSCWWPMIEPGLQMRNQPITCNHYNDDDVDDNSDDDHLGSVPILESSGHTRGWDNPSHLKQRSD